MNPSKMSKAAAMVKKMSEPCKKILSRGFDVVSKSPANPIFFLCQTRGNIFETPTPKLKTRTHKILQAGLCEKMGRKKVSHSARRKWMQRDRLKCRPPRRVRRGRASRGFVRT